jgi:hypothetical protein
LHFKRTNIDAAVHYPIKTGAALVEQWRRSKIRVACADRGAAGQQRMSEGWTAVVL